MSMHHDPSKAVRIRPLRPQTPEQRHWWDASVPAWAVLSLLPIGAIALGGALATITMP